MQELTAEDAEKVDAIIDRIFANTDINQSNRMTLFMDLTLCHTSGTPLSLDDMLTGRIEDLAHDVIGINQNIDRATGELGNFFTPRYAVRG